MSKLYAMQGLISKELLTFRGRVIVHNDRSEMEFLFEGVRVIELPPGEFTPQQMLKVKDHPDFSSYLWPLTRNRFNDGTSDSYESSARRAARRR